MKKNSTKNNKKNYEKALKYLEKWSSKIRQVSYYYETSVVNIDDFKQEMFFFILDLLENKNIINIDAYINASLKTQIKRWSFEHTTITKMPASSFVDLKNKAALTKRESFDEVEVVVEDRRQKNIDFIDLIAAHDCKGILDLHFIKGKGIVEIENETGMNRKTIHKEIDRVLRIIRGELE